MKEPEFFCPRDVPGDDDREEEEQEDGNVYPEPGLFPGMTEEEIQDELDEDDEEDFWP